MLTLDRQSFQELREAERVREHARRAAQQPRPAANKRGEKEIGVSSGHSGEPAIAHTFVDYEPAPRAHGVTTFNAGRLIGLSIEGLTSFSVAPLRFASLLGALLAGAAFLFGLSILWEVLTTGKQVPGYPSLMIGVMTIGGVQLIMIGIVGEYIGKILSELKARPIYFVAEHTEKHADGGAAQSATERTAAE